MQKSNPANFLSSFVHNLFKNLSSYKHDFFIISAYNTIRKAIDQFKVLITFLHKLFHNPPDGSSIWHPPFLGTFFTLQTSNPHKTASAIPPYPQAFPIYQPEYEVVSWQTLLHHDNKLPAHVPAASPPPVPQSFPIF